MNPMVTVRYKRCSFSDIQYDDDLSAGSSRFFAACTKASKINLVRCRGGPPRHRCYAGEQFVAVPDKKGQTVSRREITGNLYL